MRRFVLFVVLVTSIAGAQAPEPALAKGVDLLEQGRTSLDEGKLAAARAYFADLAEKDSNNFADWYALARVQAYQVEAFVQHNKKKDAERALDDAIASVQRAISINDKSADAHSLLADLYGRKTSIGGGFMAGAKFGPKSDSENKKALAIDPQNPRVHASLGRQYLHAPRMFGGDVDKAIAQLKQATELDPKSDENFVWLSVAYRKKGDTAAADKALQEALRLNPQSQLALNADKIK
ncbi:MAG TPA: tetratricopeptide repeat protein [Terriglobales bacterium]|nr:tetratricopeptide repeat protein [Terriglobales bacterium]